jgi:imidazoleglycerol-phosphate dehydratase
MKKRTANFTRKTRETNIGMQLTIDGAGKSVIQSPVGLLNHLLELFAFHGLFDLRIKAQGDARQVDIHHTNEDIGIVLGEVFKKAIGTKQGIRRFGYAIVPMEDVLATVAIDINGRGYFKLILDCDEHWVKGLIKSQGGYLPTDAEHFLDAFAKHLGMNLHITIQHISTDLHTNLEPVFKALGLALDQATTIDPRRKGVPSTKGIID